jgi:NAD+ synthase (glutamine-hydrolysing)
MRGVPQRDKINRPPAVRILIRPRSVAADTLFLAPLRCHSPEMTFYSLYAQGFARVAACSTETALANPARNAEAILTAARDCHQRGVAVAVFPELTLSGYSIEDLLLQDTLLDAVEEAVAAVLDASKDLLPVLVIGAPLRHAGRLYNTALVLHRGRLLGVVPKSYLPTYR